MRQHGNLRAMLIGGFAEQLLRLAAIACFMLSLSSCHRDEMSGKVVVIPRKVSGLLWLSEHLGITEAAEQHHLTIYWQGPNEDDDVDEQYKLMQHAARSHAAGIIFSPDANWTFRHEVTLARERDIPVVIEGYAAGSEAEDGVSLILSDDRIAGHLIASRLGAQLPNGGEVLLVGSDSLAPGVQERSKAVRSAVAAEQPKLTIFDSPSGEDSAAHSEFLIFQTLEHHPHIRAVISLSQEDTIAAVHATRVVDRSHELRILGYDQSRQTLMLLRKGLVDSLLVQDNRQQGRLAVETLVQMRAGVERSCTRFVPPVLVTSDNIEDEAIQQVLLMHR